MCCPYCGYTEISMQIVAFGIFQSGEFQTLELGENICFLPEATAVCLSKSCGGEFLWRQFRGASKSDED
jgi:hypothetical protein